jgi:hypothetical protein
MEFIDISDDCTASIFIIKEQADQGNSSLLLETFVLGLPKNPEDGCSYVLLKSWYTSSSPHYITPQMIHHFTAS